MNFRNRPNLSFIFDGVPDRREISRSKRSRRSGSNCLGLCSRTVSRFKRLNQPYSPFLNIMVNYYFKFSIYSKKQGFAMAFGVKVIYSKIKPFIDLSLFTNFPSETAFAHFRVSLIFDGIIELGTLITEYKLMGIHTEHFCTWVLGWC